MHKNKRIFIIITLLSINLYSQEKNITNSIGVEFQLIKSGEFIMGYNESVKGGQNFESPEHKVVISKDYYIGKYEITQSQFEKIMGNNPSKSQDPNFPVNMVSCSEAEEFCEKLSKIDGHKYRLPTEAEWEFACRAGSTTQFYWGDDFDLLDEYEWYEGNSKNKLHPVGEKHPNAWGLYDMTGNVSEWCSDRFARYSLKMQVDPKGSRKPWKKNCPSRGGNYLFNKVFHFRVSFRHPVNRNEHDVRNGFRIIREIDE